MRLTLIAFILILTGGAFFGATQSIDAASNDLADQKTADAVMALQSEFETEKETYLAKISEVETQSQEQIAAFEAKLASQADVADELAQALAAVDATAAEKAALSQENADVLIQLAILNTENASLSDELSAAQTALNAKTDALAAIQGEASDLRAQLATLQDASDLPSDQVAAQDAASVATAEATDANTVELEALLRAKEEVLRNAEAEIAALAASLDAQKQLASDLGGQIVLGAKEAEAMRVALASTSTSAPADTATDAQPVADIIAPIVLTAVQCNEYTQAIFAEQAVTFGVGSNTLSDASVVVLDELVAFAPDCISEGMTLTIGAHTDSAGSEVNNLALSENRAGAVSAFLMERGLPEEAMLSVGYGEAEPIADNATAEGRAQNRRITFEWQ